MQLDINSLLFIFLICESRNIKHIFFRDTKLKTILNSHRMIYMHVSIFKKKVQELLWRNLIKYATAFGSVYFLFGVFSAAYFRTAKWDWRGATADAFLWKDKLQNILAKNTHGETCIEILSNQTEIRLYLPFSDLFGTKQICKWKSVITM